MSWGLYIGAALILAGFVSLVVWREKVKVGSVKSAGFLTEVVAEVKKITWPTKDDLRKATMVILLFVTLVAIIIGTMDIVLQWLLVRLPSRIS